MSLLNNKEEGWVYIFKIWIDDKIIYKIGVTAQCCEIRSPIDRLLQVCRSFFQKYRYVPKCRVMKYKKHDDRYGIEAELHRHFKDKKYVPEYKFDGSNEMFDIDETELLEIYDIKLKDIK